MRVLLLHDEVFGNATPDERDVLVQCDAVATALADLGHESTRLACTLDLEQLADDLRIIMPDLVFNLVESIGAQGRLIHLAPSLLESLNVAFTGCSAAAMFATSSKLISKQLLERASIPTARFYTPQSLKRTPRIVPGRYILKSVWEHASRGLDEDSVIECSDAAALETAIQERLPKLAGEGFAEEFIDGREFNLSVLAGQVLPPAEIIFDGYDDAKLKVVGYRAKWDETSFEYHHTPRRFNFPAADAPLLARLTDLALQSWREFDLRGHARVDFRVNAAGQPFVLEVNANPCLSPDAGFAAAVQNAGLTFTQAIERIIHDLPR